MNKVLSLVFAFCVVGFQNMAFCETRNVDSLNEVLEVFKNIRGETLGVFDIDMVLIQNTLPAFQMPNMKKHKHIFKELFGSLTSVEKDLTLNLTINSGKTMLIEPSAIHILRKIKQFSPKMITLTASLSGNLGNVKNMTKLRFKQLKSVGLDFSQSFPELKLMNFTNLPLYLGSYPEYYQGIISANGGDKGKVLIKFLKAVNYFPNTVVFVDDQEKNVIAVGEALERFDKNIQFVGIVYRGAEKYLSESVTADVFKDAWSDKIHEAKKLAKEKIAF